MLKGAAVAEAANTKKTLFKGILISTGPAGQCNLPIKTHTHTIVRIDAYNSHNTGGWSCLLRSWTSWALASPGWRCATGEAPDHITSDQTYPDQIRSNQFVLQRVQRVWPQRTGVEAHTKLTNIVHTSTHTCTCAKQGPDRDRARGAGRPRYRHCAELSRQPYQGAWVDRL